MTSYTSLQDAIDAIHETIDNYDETMSGADVIIEAERMCLGETTVEAVQAHYQAIYDADIAALDAEEAR